MNSSRSTARYVFGGILVAFGALLLLSNTDVINLDWLWNFVKDLVAHAGDCLGPVGTGVRRDAVPVLAGYPAAAGHRLPAIGPATCGSGTSRWSGRCSSSSWGWPSCWGGATGGWNGSGRTAPSLRAASSPARCMANRGARCSTVSKTATWGRDFRGGEVESNFGNVALDLREAGLAGGSATLNVQLSFGGLHLRVPPGWRVNVGQVATSFGHVQDNRAKPEPEDADGELHIRGTIAFGNLEIND